MSAGARDLRYGRRGGRWLAEETPQQRAVRKAELIRTKCACATWLAVPSQVNKACRACGEPMRKIAP